MGADEPRYAQVAREMLQRHDWITPTLYGNVWLEKPVLYYWGAIVSYKIFGVSDWAARLPGAVFATVDGGVPLFLGSAVPQRRATRCHGDDRDHRVRLRLCSRGFDGHSTGGAAYRWVAGVVDVLRDRQRALAGAVLCGDCAWERLGRGRYPRSLAAMIIVVFLALRRDWQAILRTLWIPGILIFCLIALPWYLAVQHANPGFFREFFIQHNLDRFATNRFQHHQPIWYYVPVLLAGDRAVDVLRLAWHSWRGLKSVRQPKENALLGFLALWVGLPFLFFSVSQSKLPGYILPSIAPCGILVALYLRELAEEAGEAFAVLIALHALALRCDTRDRAHRSIQAVSNARARGCSQDCDSAWD